MSRLIQQRIKDPVVLNDYEQELLLNLKTNNDTDGIHVSMSFWLDEVDLDQLVCDGWLVRDGSMYKLAKDNPPPFNRL